jgi:hypothetical protein
MKIITTILIVLLLPMATAEDNWDQWCKEYNKKLDSAMQLPEQERIPILQEVVLIGPRVPDKHKLEGDRLKIFIRAQSALLAIPGHAEYYSKRIRGPFEEFKNPPSDLYTNASGRFLREMMWGGQTLEQLPSPETVKVLGEMLTEEWVTPHKPWPGESRIPSLAACAYHPLNNLPIVDSPIPPNYMQLDEGGQLKIWQAWYAEIKSGLRALAFKGEPREYRFKPDGTWDTIPISLPLEEVVSKEHVSVTFESVVTPPVLHERTWIWITGLSVLFLAVMGWLIRKKIRA